MLEGFRRGSQSGSLNKNKESHDSIIKHTNESFSFTNHAKRLIKEPILISRINLKMLPIIYV